MEQAIKVETNVQGLTIRIGDDGLWLEFSEDGSHAAVNLSCYAAKNKGDIIGRAILKWCIATAKRNGYPEPEIKETYDCVIHGKGDGPDCPRC